MEKTNMKIFLSTVTFQKTPNQWGYIRVDNPTRIALESELANLERAKHALAFSSGSSAIACLFMLLKKGDHILCHCEIYEGTHRLLEKIFKKMGVQFDLANFKNLKDIKRHIKKNTKLIFFENITNPNLDVIDISKICEITKENNILVAVDNTICTPVFEKPLLKGADIVIHSLTKFIGGHHNVLGGAIMLNNSKIFKELRFIQQTVGFVLSPTDCFLVNRGMKTLETRMKKQTENASQVFGFLKTNKNITKVSFPGISAVVSFTVDSKIKPKIFLKKLKVIKIAQSFGAVESTILHPASMMILATCADNNFFRLSVGLEKSKALIADLKEALK